MKKLSTLLLCAAISCVFGSELKTYVYPSLIYDDGRCSFYQDRNSLLSFLFFHNADKPLNDVDTASRLILELPTQFELTQAVIMDGWKTPCMTYDKFTSEDVSRDGMAYRRHTLPLPKSAIRPAIRKPLAGGMFGGTSNNILNVSVKPNGNAPEKFTVYWEITGKYQDRGAFPGYTVALPPPAGKKLRTLLLSHAPSVNLGFSDQMLENLAAVYKHVGVQWVNAQLPDGPNRGNRSLWEKAGFQFYGGGSLMHVLINLGMEGRSASPDLSDYLVGLDGKRAFNTDPRAYHGRIWCPTAAITPGRYPWKLFQERAKNEIEQGCEMLDIDLETHTWSHCFCPDCRREFSTFAKVPDDNLPPAELVRKYPLQWYKFRSEQTRIIYARLKESFPQVKIGANTVLHHFEQDLGDLKYGMCDFAEDPRLFGGSIEYVLADTLAGGVYDGISVDAMRRSVTVPIIAVAGSSYCVGFDMHCTAARKMTADMTGDTYGYNRRADFNKLSILHLAASGAAGLRLELEEAAVARSAAEAVRILAEIEDFYLDGARSDEILKVADLTSKPTPWNDDRSRVGGQVWRHFYDKYCGLVQYRVHRLNGKTLISLFNWDPFQAKEWHLSLAENAKDPLYLTDVIAGGGIKWERQGVKVQVPSYGFRIFLLAAEKPAKIDSTVAAVQPAAAKPYNQYAWRQATQIDIGKVAEKGIAEAMKRLNDFGGAKAIPAPKGNAAIPFTADFKATQDGLKIWGAKNDDGMESGDKYAFGSLELGSSETALKLTVGVKVLDGAAFSALLLERNPQTNAIGKTLQTFTPDNQLKPETVTLSWDIEPANLKNPTSIYFYNNARKGNIVISGIKLEPTVIRKPVNLKGDAVIPFVLDLENPQAGIHVWGTKNKDGIDGGNKYCFAGLDIPVSARKLKLTVTGRTSGGGTFGAVLYARDPKTNAVTSPRQRFTWGNPLQPEDMTLQWYIDTDKSSTRSQLLFYNVAKTGNVVISAIKLEPATENE